MIASLHSAADLGILGWFLAAVCVALAIWRATVNDIVGVVLLAFLAIVAVIVLT